MPRQNLHRPRPHSPRGLNVQLWLDADHLPPHELRHLPPPHHAQRQHEDPHPLLDAQRLDQDHSEQCDRKRRPHPHRAGDQPVRPAALPPTRDHPQNCAGQYPRQHPKQRQRHRLPGPRQHQCLHISPYLVGAPGEDSGGGEGGRGNFSLDDHHSVNLVRIGLGQPFAEQGQTEEAQHQQHSDQQRRIAEHAAQHPSRSAQSRWPTALGRARVYRHNRQGTQARPPTPCARQRATQVGPPLGDGANHICQPFPETRFFRKNLVSLLLPIPQARIQQRVDQLQRQVDQQEQQPQRHDQVGHQGRHS